jgi:putative ABC transport system permease protein
LQPSVFVPHQTFDRVKPQATVGGVQGDLVSNLIIVQLRDQVNLAEMARVLENEVGDIQAVDRQAAYENTPGYSAQQSTLNTQRFFSLLIGILVIGGFFQIQTLQKVPQIGMLKAIGAPNGVIAVAAVTQIFAITLLGVALGTAVTLLLALTFPATVPIAFSANAIVLGIGSLMTIGPLGGLVSVRYALRVEPLLALGLTG